jgi:hypothetical protein
MRHISETDQLQAMKDSLGDLDSLKLLSPGDLEILDLRRSLKEQIAVLEQQQPQAEVSETERSSKYRIAA